MKRLWSISLGVLAMGLVSGCAPSRPSAEVLSSASEAMERIAEKGPVKLIVTVAPAKPRLSDFVDLDIEVLFDDQVEIKPPVFGRSVGDFLVRDYSEGPIANPRLEANETHKRQARRFHYRLEPVHSGLHLIRSIAVEFVDQRAGSENRGQFVSIESEPIEIEITSELGDKLPDLADLAPMIPPRPLSSTSSWIWGWIALPLAILASLLVWMSRKKASKVALPVSLTPAEIAHQALKALLAEDLPAQKRFQEFYLRLTGIVRSYIEGTTGVRAPEQTTEEFLRAMHLGHLFEPAQSVRLQEFLEAADMVKYAGQQPDPEQIEVSIVRAGEFVHLPSSASTTIALKEGR